MNREILILRNTPRENPGLIEIVLKERNINYQIVDFDHTTAIKSIKSYLALIVLGGPESANDQTPKMLRELAFIKNAVESEVPYLGICLGLQTFVKALGGNVLKCQTSEAGFRDHHGVFFKNMEKLFRLLPI